MTHPQPDRHPLRKVAASVVMVAGLLSTLVTGLVGYGVVTSVQGDAVVGLLGLIPGVITAVGTTIAAFQTAHSGEHEVTPVADPRANDGTPLVPETSGPGSVPFPR